MTGTNPIGEKPAWNVAVVQCNPIFGRVSENLERVRRLITATTADLLVLPELFNTGYLFTSVDEVAGLAEPIPDGPTTAFLKEEAARRGCFLAGGLAERAPGPDGNELYYNSAILTGPGGLLAHYRKLHLFDRENLWFSPGNLPFAVHDLGGLKVGLLICFDWIFPEAARCLALLGADLLIHPSNLVLPHCPDAMITRCLENRVYAATANRVGTEERGGVCLEYIGRSQIIDATGRVLVRGGGLEECVLEARVQPAHSRDKRLGTHNHLFNDRRPDFYPTLCLPTRGSGGGEDEKPAGPVDKIPGTYL